MLTFNSRGIQQFFSIKFIKQVFWSDIPITPVSRLIYNYMPTPQNKRDSINYSIKKHFSFNILLCRSTLSLDRNQRFLKTCCCSFFASQDAYGDLHVIIK